ncbi:MAG TPA: hypothetical protein VHI54_03335 [Actinomycetota bacterium]|nr:hypothetical protein [Actinomycetota bacterium]
MATTPREPRFRILVAVVLTAAIGGMFLAGEFRNQAGAPLSSAPADRRVAQQAPPVATAPSADEILTYNGRDPFTRDQEEKKASQKPPAADPLTPVAQSVTPLAPSAGVTVSVGNAASPLSGVGSTRTSPVTRRGDDDGDDLDVVVKVPRVDEPTVVDPLVDPMPVYPVPVADGGGAGSPEPDGTLDRGGKWGKTKNKPAKAEHGEAPPYPAYQPTKEKSWKDRGHKGQSSRPGRRVGQTRSGWRGKGHAWGWKAARCDESHPSSNGHCRR